MLLCERRGGVELLLALLALLASAAIIVGIGLELGLVVALRAPFRLCARSTSNRTRSSD